MSMAHYLVKPGGYLNYVCKICSKPRFEHGKAQWSSHRTLYWSRNGH